MEFSSGSFDTCPTTSASLVRSAASTPAARSSGGPNLSRVTYFATRPVLRDAHNGDLEGNIVRILLGSNES
ncbi:unnamed protein product [Leptosia nina]|uniref:Uncharacterized protein n=1 Tax=Leptosia nina TaxID=320188 RepID=A0AAV1J586_9NEOP